jgi:hypothetical protein
MRFVFLRFLGFIYFIAFLVLAQQAGGLFGEKGLLPAQNYIETVLGNYASKSEAFISVPTIFYFHFSDSFMSFCAWTAVALSLLVMFGYANSIILAILWFLYLSFTHIGQIFYGYGWEILLLEIGLLAVFFVPLFDARPFPKRPPSLAMVWLLRWVSFRLMIGAGLIKIRGDACWLDLTCLYYHYETQPVPNPLTPFFHFMPLWFHRLGVFYNHVAELIAPWALFMPRTIRHLGGFVMVVFQVILIFSGNLAFLNWLSLVCFTACFDDRFYRRILPGSLVRRAEKAAANSEKSSSMRVAIACYVIFVLYLSISPIQNLLSKQQIMNTSFNRWHVVNTYGAFGTVGKLRDEIIIEGSMDGITWKEYEFHVKPGDPFKRSKWISPYHYRLDWQIWFAAMQSPDRNPWLIHLLWKFLHNDAKGLSMIAKNPFPEEPPKWVRCQLYRYQYAPLGNSEQAIWTRKYLKPWLRPLSTEDELLKNYVGSHKWEEFKP